MRGRISMIGDYEDESKTYAVVILAHEDEVEGFSDGDEVIVSPVRSSNEGGEG